MLDNILKPGQPLPPDDLMISKALEILNNSPHGQQLVNTVEQEKIAIAVMATPQAQTYLPEPRKAYVGFNRNFPLSPSAFVLMLAGVLREAQQELAGISHPPLTAPRDEHVKIGVQKYEDKMWYMCMVAWELNQLEIFANFKFLDELRKMGHSEAIDLFLKQEKNQG